jgi:hypothetical protein
MRTALIAFILMLSGSAIAGDLPNKHKTPGATDPRLTTKVLCARGFTTKNIRDVSQDLKEKVYASYGLTIGKKPCPCEIDHLISLEIGGNNAQKNLWPQSYQTKPWNARVKDRLENALHKLVCAGSISLKQAQHEISNNWIGSYKTHCKGNACPAWRPPK